jgi:hypothetical protein
VRCDRVVQRGVEDGDERGRGVVRLAGPEPDARLVPRRRHSARYVDPETHPRPFEGLLHHGRDRGLPRLRGAVQDDDLSGRLQLDDSVGGAFVTVLAKALLIDPKTLHLS